MNILIVEDESLVALELVEYILSLNYSVRYTTQVDMVNKLIKEKEIDILLMDINLNSMIDGIDLYSSLDKKIPIIYLTAYSDESTIQKAIQTEPLGFLNKPYIEGELKALLQLAEYKLNKKDNFDRGMISIGKGYYFDHKKDKLFYESVFINLSKKELKLLKLLIESKGNPVSYENILAEVWGQEEVSSDSLRMLIYRLRTKLEHKLIKNEFNYGIRL